MISNWNLVGLGSSIETNPFFRSVYTNLLAIDALHDEVKLFGLNVVNLPSVLPHDTVTLFHCPLLMDDQQG